MDRKSVLKALVSKSRLNIDITIEHYSYQKYDLGYILKSINYKHYNIIVLYFEGWVKRKVVEIALKLPEDSWGDFRIVPYEDRTSKGGRPY